MRYAIDTKTIEIVKAERKLDSEFICPGCGTWIYPKFGRGKRGAYFAHARGVARYCKHKDENLLPILLEEGGEDVASFTYGFKSYFARMERKAEKMARLVQALNVKLPEKDQRSVP